MKRLRFTIITGTIIFAFVAFWWYSAFSSSVQLIRTLDTAGMPMTFWPGSQTLAVGFLEDIQLWDARKGTLLRTLKKPRIESSDLLLSPDHKILASSIGYLGKKKGDANPVVLSDMKSGKVLRRLMGAGGTFSGGEIIKMAFSPDGKLLAGGSSDNTVRLWSVQTGKLLHTLKGHSELVWLVAFSRDGKTLASAETGTGPIIMRLWNVQAGKLKKKLQTHQGVAGAMFLPDNKTLLVVGTNGEDSLRNVSSGKLTILNLNEDGSAEHVAFTPDGKFYATACWSVGLFHNAAGKVVVRETKTGRLICTITKDMGAVHSVLLSPDAKLLVIDSDDYGTATRQIKVWQIR